jgi:putative glycosyltransferase
MAAAPLTILVYAGLAVFALTLITSIYFLIVALFRSGASGIAMVLLAIFFFGSLITLVLGIIGIYLANIYIEVRRRPLFLIAEETK